MKRNGFLLQIVICALMLIISLTSFAYADVNVVATTLGMADLVRNIGRDKVEADSLSKGKIDMHFFQPRPSHVLKLRKADMLVISGMDLDIWVQSLIEASRNSKIRFGATGYVDASDGVVPLDVPLGKIDASMGDVHPHGNPHFWFTEENIKTAIENVYMGLVRVDPESRDYYLKQKNDYIAKVRTEYAKLRNMINPYKGTKVIQFHKSWDYFCKEFELEIVGELEPKPGVSPSPAHLQQLVEMIKQENVKIMLVEPYYPKGPVGFIKRNTDISVLRLPNYVGSKQGISSYLKNLEYIVGAIVDVLN